MKRVKTIELTDNKTEEKFIFEQEQNRFDTEYLCLFLIGIIILFLRSAHTLTMPHIYTEDGSWSGMIWQNGFLRTLFNARADYLVFGNVILLKMAQIFNDIFFGDNLSYYPLLISIISYCFFSLLALTPVIYLKKVLVKPVRIFIWLLILLLPLGDTSYEIIGRISNVGYAVYFIVYCLLVWRKLNSQTAKKYNLVIVDGLIFIACATNPICIPLVVVAFLIDIISEYRKNSKESFVQGTKKVINKFYFKSWISNILLITISFIYIFIRMLKKDIPVNSSGEVINFSETIEFLARNILFNFVYPIYYKLTNKIVIMLLVILIASLIFIYRYLHKTEKKFFISAVCATIFLISTMFITRPGLTNLLNNYTTTFPDRYFYGQNLMMLIIISIPISEAFRAGKNKVYRNSVWALAVSLVFLYIFQANYIFEFTSPRMDLPSKNFKTKIEEAFVRGSEGDGYTVEIEFAGWDMWVPKEKIFATILEQRNVGIESEFCLKTSNLTDINWTKGTSNNDATLLIENNIVNQIVLRDAKQIKIGAMIKKIVEVKPIDENWIYLIVDDNIKLSAFAYPNVVEVIK